jgi:hypothetical protein
LDSGVMIGMMDRFNLTRKVTNFGASIYVIHMSRLMISRLSSELFFMFASMMKTNEKW